MKVINLSLPKISTRVIKTSNRLIISLNLQRGLSAIGALQVQLFGVIFNISLHLVSEITLYVTVKYCNNKINKLYEVRDYCILIKRNPTGF